ncbi:MAG: ABC transporter transmembrane domain-containing protein, partial [Pseudomonadota bacterium]
LTLGVAEALGAFLVGWAIDLARAAEIGGYQAQFFAEEWLALLGIGFFLLVARPVLMAINAGLSSLSITPGLAQLSIWRLHLHTLGQSVSYFQDDFAGRISQKELQTANAAATSTNEVLNSITYGLSAVIGAALVLGAASGLLLLLLTLWFAAYVALVARYLPMIRSAARARADTRSALSGRLVDQISHIETVKLFAHTGR